MPSPPDSPRRPSRRTLAGAALLLVVGTVPVLIPLVATRSPPTAGPGAAGRTAAADPSGGQVAPVVPGPPAAAPGPLAPLSSSAPAEPRTGPSSVPTRPAASTPATPPMTPPPTSRQAGPPAVTGADLVVTEVSSTPDQLTEGSVVTFQAIVRNDGTEATPAGGPDILFVLDGVPVSWSRSDTSPLRPGEERLYVADGGPVSATWTATPGRHRLVVTADAGGRLAEPNERNNTDTWGFRVR